MTEQATNLFENNPMLTEVVSMQKLFENFKPKAPAKVGFESRRKRDTNWFLFHVQLKKIRVRLIQLRSRLPKKQSKLIYRLFRS